MLCCELRHRMPMLLLLGRKQAARMQRSKRMQVVAYCWAMAESITSARHHRQYGVMQHRWSHDIKLESYAHGQGSVWPGLVLPVNK